MEAKEHNYSILLLFLGFSRNRRQTRTNPSFNISMNDLQAPRFYLRHRSFNILTIRYSLPRRSGFIPCSRPHSNSFPNFVRHHRLTCVGLVAKHLVALLTTADTRRDLNSHPSDSHLATAFQDHLLRGYSTLLINLP